MKLLGLNTGSIGGQTEILMKEALMAADEAGAETELLRLLEFDVQSCRFCKRCLKREGGPENCIVRDDVPFIMEKLVECDGLIVGAPVYILTPPGYFKLLCDRVLEDRAGMEAAKRGEGIFGENKNNIDKRIFKDRVGGFISIGGASTLNWLSLGLPMMHCLTFPRQIEIVDQMQITAISRFGGVIMNDEALARARKLGRNIAEAMGKPADKLKWMGDEKGLCPVCHCDLLTVKGKNPVECPICGIEGTLKMDGNNIKVTFSKKQRDRSRLTIAGKWEHQLEIQRHMKLGIQGRMENKDEMEKREKIYKSYKSIVKPPKKAKKKKK